MLVNQSNSERNSSCTFLSLPFRSVVEFGIYYKIDESAAIIMILKYLLASNCDIKNWQDQ